MSVNVHITRINDTFSNCASYLDAGQTALLTDQDNEHMHRLGSNFYFPAMSKHWDGASWTYHSAVFNDVTAYGTMYAAQYIKHYGDTDTGFGFTDNQVDMFAGNVSFVNFQQTTQNVLNINPDQNDIDTAIFWDSATPALFIQGSSGNVGIGTSAPETKLHVNYGNSHTVSVAVFDAVYRLTIGEHNIEIGGMFLQAQDINETYQTNNSSRSLLLNPGGGNIGIGATAPSSLLDLQHAGGVGVYDMLELTNTTRATAANGHTGVLFNLADSSDNICDAARIWTGAVGTWTSTASTQDAFMAFGAAWDGTITECFRISTGWGGVDLWLSNNGILFGGTVGSSPAAYIYCGVGGNDLRISAIGEVEFDGDVRFNCENIEGDVLFESNTTNVVACLYDATAEVFRFNDNYCLKFGTDDDGSIHYDSSYGDLIIHNIDRNIELICDSGSVIISAEYFKHGANNVVSSARATGSNTTPNGTLTVVIDGVSYYLLKAATAS